MGEDLAVPCSSTRIRAVGSICGGQSFTGITGKGSVGMVSLQNARAMIYLSSRLQACSRFCRHLQASSFTLKGLATKIGIRSSSFPFFFSYCGCFWRLYTLNILSRQFSWRILRPALSNKITSEVKFNNTHFGSKIYLRYHHSSVYSSRLCSFSRQFLMFLPPFSTKALLLVLLLVLLRASLFLKGQHVLLLAFLLVLRHFCLMQRQVVTSLLSSMH